MILGKVESQKLTISHDLIVSDTIDYLTAKFELSPEWAGRGVTAVFTKGETSYAIQLVNGEITADKHLNLSEGVWEVNLYGTDVHGTRITTSPADISVKRTGNMEGAEPGAIPPSIAEQLDARVTALEAGGGGGGTGGVSKEYVDRQDDEMLMDAMEYTDNQIKLVPTPDVDKAYVDKQDKATAAAVDSKLNGYLKTGDISAWAKQPEKPAYTASEVGALSDSTEIPKALADLTDDVEHRTVSDAEKQKWNAGGSGTTDYNALSNKPTINNIELKGNVTTQQLGIKDGKDGAPGPAGADGKPGKDGAPGKDGKDATFGYEEGSEPTTELKANVFHKFTTPAPTITVTVAPATGYAEYAFQFTTASSGGNLSIPADFAWNGGKAPSLEANKTYQVVLLSGTAYISGGVAV